MGNKRIIFLLIIFVIIFASCKDKENAPIDVVSSIPQQNVFVDLGGSTIVNDIYKEDFIYSVDAGEIQNDLGLEVDNFQNLESSSKSNQNNAVIELKNKYFELSQKYSEIYGWIYVSGTNINYPVVQTINNTKYLRRDLDDKYSLEGTIFVDYENSKNPSIEKNLIIYGHNIGTPVKFGTLLNMRNKDIFSKSLIYIFVDDKIYIYQPFSEFLTNTNLNYLQVSFESENKYLDFLTKLKNLSINKNNVSISSTDNIITLSTCTNRDDEERYVVFGKLLSIVN